ncbi:MAG TPA: RNase adapter RapZ [Vicinamibacterales bacterium]
MSARRKTTVRTARKRQATAGRTPQRTRGETAAARRPDPDAPMNRFIVLTGLSGAGKSQAMRALEDLGYFCVDNLPIALLPTFAELTRRPDTELDKAAVVVDVRESTLLEQFPRVFEQLRAMPGLRPTLIFLEASEAVLVRRYSETRRPHPLARNRSALEGVREERQQLEPIRRMADEIIDTSDMNVHELRDAFMARSLGAARRGLLTVTFLSFGFKYGLPLEADLVFDVRFLPNPHFVSRLRERTGRDRPVVRFLDQFEDTKTFLDKTTDMLRFLVPRYAREGKSYLTVAIGCTGGRHRSVAIAEALAKSLRGLDGVRLRVRHRDVANA